MSPIVLSSILMSFTLVAPYNGLNIEKERTQPQIYTLYKWPENRVQTLPRQGVLCHSYFINLLNDKGKEVLAFIWTQDLYDLFIEKGVFIAFDIDVINFEFVDDKKIPTFSIFINRGNWQIKIQISKEDFEKEKLCFRKKLTNLEVVYKEPNWLQFYCIN